MGWTKAQLPSNVHRLKKKGESMFDFWKKKPANPLQTPKEMAIDEITSKLRAFPVYDRHEIVMGILCRVFPEPTHLRRNPRKKEVV